VGGREAIKGINQGDAEGSAENTEFSKRRLLWCSGETT